ncbi:hypothetical protein BpHYR1_010767 [Brachionus plicatilis]|uniref:Uncharacterized protein n=1 Tax=Brachionus plicatilis TaxID=10195 RepID=A0A3M7QLZ0_BRAPC|nr:hypothetical protein BpHYR1_010767 [Brachionus plicatilis]
MKRHSKHCVEKLARDCQGFINYKQSKNFNHVKLYSGDLITLIKFPTSSKQVGYRPAFYSSLKIILEILPNKKNEKLENVLILARIPSKIV